MHLFGALIFVTVAHRLPSYLLVWRPAGIAIAASVDCKCLHNLKAAEGLASKQLESKGAEILPFGSLTGLGTLSTRGAYQ